MAGTPLKINPKREMLQILEKSPYLYKWQPHIRTLNFVVCTGDILCILIVVGTVGD